MSDLVLGEVGEPMLAFLCTLERWALVAVEASQLGELEHRGACTEDPVDR